MSMLGSIENNIQTTEKETQIEYFRKEIEKEREELNEENAYLWYSTSVEEEAEIRYRRWCEHNTPERKKQEFAFNRMRDSQKWRRRK